MVVSIAAHRPLAVLKRSALSGDRGCTSQACKEGPAVIISGIAALGFRRFPAPRCSRCSRVKSFYPPINGRMRANWELKPRCLLTSQTQRRQRVAGPFGRDGSLLPYVTCVRAHAHARDTHIIKPKITSQSSQPPKAFKQTIIYQWLVHLIKLPGVWVSSQQAPKSLPFKCSSSEHLRFVGRLSWVVTFGSPLCRHLSAWVQP